MFWAIRSFPACRHHLFLSHSAEDRVGLVLPLHAELVGRGFAAWLDRHDYPYGRSSRSALRDSILRCRHTVLLVTDATLTQARGWCVQELAWAELLQDNLVQPGGPSLQNVILPLYFVSMADDRLPRSVWQAVRDRGTFWPGQPTAVEWAAGQIEGFLRREEALAAELAEMIPQVTSFRRQLAAVPGLGARVARFDPQPLPPTPPGSPPPADA